MDGKKLVAKFKDEIWKDGNFTSKGVELIKKTIAKNATDIELQMFLHMCGQYQLDPFLNEIYFMKRKVWNSYRKDYDEIPTMMVSRDGFLSIAHKSGQFDGMETVSLYDPETKVLKGAKCTVYNKSCAHPITQSVLFSEYCVYTKDKATGKLSPQALWGTKPETMIKKVAEAQALRKAFNIHGVYLQEEIDAELAKESMGELENMAETIKTAETIHSTEENYDKWSEETMTHILDALQECKVEADVWKVQKQYETDIKTLQDKDRVYIMEMIDNARQNIITGAQGDEEEGEGSEAKESGQGEPAEGEEAPEKTKVIKPNPTVINTDALRAKEEFGKKWLPDAVKAIQACTTKAQIQAWKHNNISKVMSLLTEARDYIRSIYQEQFDKVKDK